MAWKGTTDLRKKWLLLGVPGIGKSSFGQYVDCCPSSMMYLHAFFVALIWHYAHPFLQVFVVAACYGGEFASVLSL